MLPGKDWAQHLDRCQLHSSQLSTWLSKGCSTYFSQIYTGTPEKAIQYPKEQIGIIMSFVRLFYDSTTDWYLYLAVISVAE